MQIFKKEKQVVELALQHAEKTGECLRVMSVAVKSYVASEHAGLEEASKTVGRLETDADELLREIRELLYSGAYLPTIRGDLYRLLSAVDKIANRTEDCLDFVYYQRPAAANQYASQIGDILDLTTTCFDELQLALRAFFKPKGAIETLRAKVRDVGELETKIDKTQRKVTIALFKSELELAQKVHLEQLLSRIARISDQVENVADELELLSLKSII